MSGRFFRLGQSRERRSSFRPILLALVLAAVCWGFWNNSQRRLDMLVDQALLVDETATLSAETKKQAVAVLRTFRPELGLPLEVAVRKGPPATADYSASRMYLDIVPGQERAHFFMPPLVRRAVGDDFVIAVEDAFGQGFAQGDWQRVLLPVLLGIKDKLVEVSR